MFEANVLEGAGRANLSGQLTFSEHGRFRDVSQRLLTTSNGTVTLDFSGVDFIDSAGLGMLLLFREETKRNGRTLRLEKATGQVNRMFELSRFGTLFDLGS